LRKNEKMGLNGYKHQNTVCIVFAICQIKKLLISKEENCRIFWYPAR
jgi:hypothetical protein